MKKKAGLFVLFATLALAGCGGNKNPVDSAKTSSAATSEKTTVAESEEVSVSSKQDSASQEEVTITLNETAKTIDLFEEFDLVATVTGSKDLPMFESNDLSVVKVDEVGHVTAVAAGDAVITVTVAGKTATCAVKVEDSGARPTIGLGADHFALDLNGTANIVASLSYKGAPIAVNGNFTYASDATLVAEVDETGKVTAKTLGVAHITVSYTYKGFEATASVTINVNHEYAAYADGWTDDEYKSNYNITEDNKIIFACNDYRSTGTIYQISENIYNEVQRSDDQVVNGWEPLNKSLLQITLPRSAGGGTYPFTQWDGTVQFNNQQPLVKKFDNAYYLWFTNFTPFSDGDGGFGDWTCTLIWTKADSTTGSAVWDFKTVSTNLRKMAPVGAPDFDSTGKVFDITEDMFGSLPRAGAVVEKGGKTWFKLDNDNVGIVSVLDKAPSYKADIDSMVKTLSTMNNVNAYTAITEDGFQLWIENYAGAPWYVDNHPGVLLRALLCWKDGGTNWHQQSFLI